MTETGSSDPYRGGKEQTMSAHVPLMIRTVMSHNSRIPASEGNLASYVQVGDSRNISSVLHDWHPCPDLGPDSRGLVLNVLVE